MKLKEQIASSTCALMSMPRLGHTENMTAVNHACRTLNLPISTSTGVFWEQCLTELFEEVKIACDKVGKDLKYYLTIDYDTYFRPDDVVQLWKLMEDNPDYDIIFPLQTKRNHDYPIFNIKGYEDGAHIPKWKFGVPISECNSGHFGLTMIRVSCLEKLDKPWLHSIPNKDGVWKDGKRDADMYFWDNCNKNGVKVGLANKIRVGHIQTIVTFPGFVDNNWAPEHRYITLLEREIE